MKAAIEWFARNHVAANVLAALIVAGGLLAIATIEEEVFPEFSTDIILVTIPYPGASPEDVEQAVSARIEEEVHALDGVERVTSTSSEGVSTVTVELLSDADPRRVLDEVKARVDAIDTFPDEAESPVIRELVLRHQVLNVAVHGTADERTLKVVGERVRDEIASLPGVSQVELSNARPYEITIEVSEAALRRHGLTFTEVARAVRGASLDLPGGSIETSGGDVLVRTATQARRGEEFEALPLMTGPDGTRVLLGEVATVVDGFAETEQSARFDGAPSVLVQVFRVGDQSALEISDTVTAWVETAASRMPAGIELTVWQDEADILRSRLDLLIDNGRSGLVLVFLVLALFLRIRLAFWVSLGIPVTFLGTFAVMPALGITVNLLSLFAFLVVLGIVVDDAIVVAENVHSHRQRGADPLTAAIEGSREVSTPVTFAVLTSVVAFAPMLFIPGTTGRIWAVIPTIVIACLLFSLVESKLVLPAHLAWSRGDDRRPEQPGAWRRFQERFNAAINQFVERTYSPSLELALRHRAAVVAGTVALFLVAIALVEGGWVKRVFMPPVEADYVFADVTMPVGTPSDATRGAVERLERAARELAAELDGREPGEGGVVRHVLSSVGEQPQLTANEGNAGGIGRSRAGSHLGEVTLQLAPTEERDITSREVEALWRERAGSIPGAVEVAFESSLFSAGEPVNVQLAGPDVDELVLLAAALEADLVATPGVFDVADTFRAGKREVLVTVRPEGESLGVEQSTLARQVRQAFHGEEVQRVQRGRDDVKVVVRYPREQRTSLGDLEEMRVRTPSGAEVPFSTVATVRFARGTSSITRVDRQRAVNVTANVDSSVANANEISNRLRDVVLPTLLAEHPAVTWRFEGERKEQADVLAALVRGMALALVAIYALMAVPFRSYLQPLIVMSVIPFGLVGAIGGHLVMGVELSVLSLCGMVALTGVVVNDSLVLVDWINRRRRDGVPLREAVRQAGTARFRPILLTSLTTCAGLTPLLLEKSVQAQFLVPMAVSLAFGVMFATFLTLVLVPTVYVLLEDVGRAARFVFGSGERSRRGSGAAPAGQA